MEHISFEKYLKEEKLPFEKTYLLSFIKYNVGVEDIIEFVIKEAEENYPKEYGVSIPKDLIKKLKLQALSDLKIIFKEVEKKLLIEWKNYIKKDMHK